MHRQVSSKVYRQALLRSLLDIIENYEKVAQALEGTVFEKYLAM